MYPFYIYYGNKIHTNCNGPVIILLVPQIKRFCIAFPKNGINSRGIVSPFMKNPVQCPIRRTSSVHTTPVIPLWSITSPAPPIDLFCIALCPEPLPPKSASNKLFCKLAPPEGSSLKSASSTKYIFKFKK